jgi:hypothetical protein
MKTHKIKKQINNQRKTKHRNIKTDPPKNKNNKNEKARTTQKINKQKTNNNK